MAALLLPHFEDYPFQITPLSDDEGGGYLITFPDLPGCMSDGPTPAAAADAVQDAIACWIEAAEEDGRPVPRPHVTAA